MKVVIIKKKKNDAFTVATHKVVVEIDRFDAKWYLYLLQEAGKKLPRKINIDLITKINDGDAGNYLKKYDVNMLYSIGVRKKATDLGVYHHCDDVTAVFNQMTNITEQEIIDIGYKAVQEAKNTYYNCCETLEGKKGLWVIGLKNNFYSEIHHEEGFKVVVLYDSYAMSAYIYVDPFLFLFPCRVNLAGFDFTKNRHGIYGIEKNNKNVLLKLEDAYNIFRAIPYK